MFYSDCLEGRYELFFQIYSELNLQMETVMIQFSIAATNIF